MYLRNISQGSCYNDKDISKKVTIHLKDLQGFWFSPVAPQVTYNCYANSPLNYFLYIVQLFQTFKNL